jgi:hypothetical protein
MGATGVPVEGDPGWSVRRAPGSEEPRLRSDAYPARVAEPLGLLSGSAGHGRKHVRWRAEGVHHFAWSTSPDYIHDGGSWEDVTIHALYETGDTAWDDGVAVQRTVAALAFLDTIFGDFAWPQITNVHRIEGGGTEFPMMIMDGSAGESLIVHETAHNYTMGILANNEWKQGWLDEGFASFLGRWYAERRGGDAREIWRNDLQNVRQAEVAGTSERIALPSAAFRDFASYNLMTYTKPALVYRMLRELLGEEPFLRGLRLYYERNALRHVREEDFQRAMEEASGRDLRWFFFQWIHTTATLDYRVGQVSTTQTADGSWETSVEVVRDGDAWMPVKLRVGSETQLLERRDSAQIVKVKTAERPAEVVLDPDDVLLDIAPENNRAAVPAPALERRHA